MRLMVSKPGRVLIYVGSFSTQTLKSFSTSCLQSIWHVMVFYEILRWREHWQKHLPSYPTKNARSRSHAFWVTNDETFVKKLLSAITDAPTRTRRKNTTTTQSVAKLFALYANAKTTCFDNDLSNLLSLPTSSWAIFFLVMSYKEWIGLQGIISFYGHNTL